ncbi:MAG: cyanophycin synthetase [Candidatus Peregrinibacteria bacterium]
MKIYCSGIGGIGLSAYASLRKVRGHDVSGSDPSETEVTERLRKEGINVFREQDGSHVPADADLFVYSEAIPVYAPERMKAREFGIPSQSYFQALGELSRDSFVIAVCGTHGKSSTTAMAARMLMEASRDPTVVVGTKLPELSGRNWRAGKSDLFLLEACEYRRSFLALSPDIILLTNADGDHFDAFADMEEYRQAFIDFFRKLPKEGIIITHLSDPDCAALSARVKRSVKDVDVLPLPNLTIPGRHMQKNAQLVLGLAEEMGIPNDDACGALKGYRGCWRRMEVKGIIDQDIIVMDDYAHHPTEIRATLSGIREFYPNRRIIAVFQPHTHHRTLALYDAFTKCFSDTDELILTDVYEARADIEQGRVDLRALAADIRRVSGISVTCGGNLQEVEELLRSGKILRPHDILLCMGAGTVTGLASAMLH